MRSSALLLLSLCSAALPRAEPQPPPPPRVLSGAYNVVWTSPTDESDAAYFRGGMPVGNGDVAALVWANVSAGGVGIYLSKQDALASDTSAYKLALLQVRLEPNPWPSAAAPFRAELDLARAAVVISGAGAMLTVWVDAASSTVYVNASTALPARATVSLTAVRPAGYAPYVAPWHCEAGVTAPDALVEALPPGLPSPATLILFHANRDGDLPRGRIVASTLAAQGLASAVGAVPDLFAGRRFGVAVDGVPSSAGALRRVDAATLASLSPATSTQLRVSVLSSQAPADDAAWLAALAAQVAAAPAQPPLAAHEAYWRGFWTRSWVDVAAAPAPAPAAATAQLPVAGATLWLRASSLAGAATGSAVTNWRDESGGGCDVGQAGAGRAPRYAADGLGPGAAAVVFDGASSFLANASASLPAQATLFAVFRDDGSSGGSANATPCCSGVVSWGGGRWPGISTVPAAAGADDDLAGGGAAAAQILVLLDFDGSHLLSHGNVAGRVVAVAAVYGDGDGDGAGGGGATLLVNNCEQTSTAAVLSAAGAGVMLGSRGDEMGRYFRGALGEVVVFPRALRPAELDAMQAYLASAWPLAPSKSGGCPSGGAASGAELSQAYAVSRFMNAAQSRVVVPGTPQQPVKFNGLAWKSERPPPVVNGSATCKPGTPDCRQWGPDNWWQNLRFSYAPMLADGDWMEQDVMFDYYLRMLPFLAARSEALLGLGAGIWMTETATVFGAFSPVDYGECAGTCSRAADLPAYLQCNPYVYLDRFGDGPTGELILMFLDRWNADGDDAALRARLPWAYGAIDFFAHTFPNRSADGRVLIAPTQACETLWCPWPQSAAECVTNDAPTVAVVTRVLERLLALPPRLGVPAARVAQWRALLAAMPPLPADAATGRLLPAAAHGNASHNSESVELYSVHPARHFSAARALTAGVNLSAAVAAFRADPNAGGSAAGNNGWHQGALHAALLGLRDDVAAMLMARTRGTALPGYRFPFFASEDGMANEPATEVFSILQAAAQLALLQHADDADETVVLMAGWPCAWNVSFQLRAARNTTVTAVWAGARMQQLVVQPPERAANVLVAPGC